MVITYLKKIRTRCEEQKEAAFQRLDAAKQEHRENIELLKMLDENNDTTYALFTPREMSGFQRAKMEELVQRQKTLEKLFEEIENEIRKIDGEIFEVNSILQEAENSFRSSSQDIDG